MILAYFLGSFLHYMFFGFFAGLIAYFYSRKYESGRYLLRLICVIGSAATFGLFIADLLAFIGARSLITTTPAESISAAIVMFWGLSQTLLVIVCIYAVTRRTTAVSQPLQMAGTVSVVSTIFFPTLIQIITTLAQQ